MNSAAMREEQTGQGRARVHRGLMRGMLRSMLPSALVALAITACAPADEPPSRIRIIDPWARVVPVAGTAAVYFTLRNDGGEDRLIGAESPDARAAMVHESREERGMVRMRARPDLPVRAHGATRFAPGGLHVMLHGVKDAGRRRTIAVTLRFARHPDITIHAPVRPFDRAAP